MVQNVMRAVAAEEQDVAAVKFEQGDLVMCHAGSNWRTADGDHRDGPLAGYLGYVSEVRDHGRHTFVGFSRWPGRTFNAQCFTKLERHNPDKEDMATMKLYRAFERRR